MNPQQMKNVAERLHIEYLIENLNVRETGQLGGFDLVSDYHSFEMKSGLCIFNKKGPMENAWWALSESQRVKYEKEHLGDFNKDLFWMFVHAFTTIPSTEIHTERKLRESIYHRDVFVAQWDVYKPSPLGNSRENTKTGPYRHVSRKNLMKRMEFVKHPLDHGTSYLPKGGGMEYLLKKRQHQIAL